MSSNIIKSSFTSFRENLNSNGNQTNDQQTTNNKIPSYLQDSLRPASELIQLGKTLKPKKQVFGDYIHENCVAHFPSERGSGKTLFSLQLCLSVSGGLQSFCDESINLQGNTLFINCELNEDDIARRLAMLMKSPPKELLENYSAYEPYVLTTRKSLLSIKDKVKSIIQNCHPILVVLDNWTIAFSDGDSSDRKNATNFMLELLNLKDELKFSLVIVDHLRKGSSFKITDSDMQSGSGAKSDLADQDLFLRKSSQNDRYRLLMRRKSRNASEQAPGTAKLLHFDMDSLWFSCLNSSVNEIEHVSGKMLNDDEEKMRYAKMMKDEGKTYDQISSILGIPKTTLHNRLSK